MHEFYNPRAVEARWQARWATSGAVHADARPEAPRLCILEAMPAPTDVLSASQLMPCLVGDVLARYFRLRGHDVLRPVCWDVLGGLPERLARDEGTSPARRTARLIASFETALKALGCGHEESRSVDPSQPEHYRWTQWLFLRMRELGLIHRRPRPSKDGPRARWCLQVPSERRAPRVGPPPPPEEWEMAGCHSWGTPIPIVYCESCAPSDQGIAVPLEQLPVRRPEEPGGADAFVQTSCPRCGGPARRDVEVMEPLMDALVAWVRCLSPGFGPALVDPEQARRWLPVGVYVARPRNEGSSLLRFGLGVMHRLGLVPGHEPFARCVPTGGLHLFASVAPSALLARYGADPSRLVMLEQPDGEALTLTEARAQEASRWLERLWRLVWSHRDLEADPLAPGPLEGRAGAVRVAAHRCLKRMDEALTALRPSEGLSALRELVSTLEAVGPVESPRERAAMAEALRVLRWGLAPFAPHCAEELAEARGGLPAGGWPAYDPAVLGETTRYQVQVNGRRVCWVHVPVGAAEADVRAVAEADAAVQRHLEGKQVRRCVFVPGRVVSLRVE